MVAHFVLVNQAKRTNENCLDWTEKLEGTGTYLFVVTVANVSSFYFLFVTRSEYSALFLVW